MSENERNEERRELAEALEGYHAPPETPREEMWAEIRRGLPDGSAGGPAVDGETPGVVPLEKARPGRPAGEGEAGDGTARRRRGVRAWRPGRWAWAAAAVLVLGIGIGRWSAPPAPDADPVGGGAEVARNGGTARSTAPLRRAAHRHLSATESFLAGVRVDARRGELDPALATWARRLLTETRLLLDAPVADDPEVGPLLEDLELVLVEVTRAAEAQREEGGRAREELELLTRGMDESDLTLRIDAVLPPPTGMIGT